MHFQQQHTSKVQSMQSKKPRRPRNTYDDNNKSHDFKAKRKKIGSAENQIDQQKTRSFPKTLIYPKSKVQNLAKIHEGKNK